jgi:hypothetical protein
MVVFASWVGAVVYGLTINLLFFNLNYCGFL